MRRPTGLRFRQSLSQYVASHDPPVNEIRGRVVVTPDELTAAARKLTHGLGIAVYIRDGRIYQSGPGIEVLPPKSARPTVLALRPFTDEAE